MSCDIALVVLAGGEGSRIGGCKPARLLAGESLLDRALSRACAWSKIVAVSVRKAGQIEPGELPIIIDETDVGGPFAGLIAALRFGAARGCEFVLTIPVDMPFFPDDLLDRLISRIGREGCAMASSVGHLHPVCALWRTSVLEQIDCFLAGDQRSLRAFAKLAGFVAVEWPAEPLDPFFNINTAEDLQRAERRA